MKKGSALSLTIFILSLLFVTQFDLVIAGVSKWINEDYVKTQEFVFNQNNNFEYRAEIITMDDAYVIVDPTEIKYVSSQGNPVWKKDLASQNVAVAGGKKIIVLSERKAGDVFVLSSKGEITAKVMGLGTVRQIKVFDDKYIGVLKEDSSLVLLDTKLNLVSTTQLPKGEILDFDLNIKSQDIVAILLDLSRKEFNTKLVLASINGNISSGSNLTQEIAYEMVIDEDRINVLVDSALLSYDYKGTLETRIPIERTISRFLFHEKSDLIWIYVVNSVNDLSSPQKGNEILIFDSNGNTVAAFEPPFDDISGLAEFGDSVIIFGNRDIAVIDAAGKVLERYIGKDDIQKIHSIDNKSFGVEYNNRLEIYVKK
ncbi:MAG: hypothetical protein IBX70_09535 [Clostridia bacterium]|nr:hypothetical protein [Clostridia bacterium]